MCFQESCPVFSKPSGSTRPGCSPATHNVGYTPYPSANPPVMPPYPAPASFYPLPTGTVQPEHLKASVMSAVEHKIRQRLRERLGMTYNIACNWIFSILHSLQSCIREFN